MGVLRTVGDGARTAAGRGVLHLLAATGDPTARLLAPGGERDGHRIGPDERVLLVLAAAHRDPAAHPDPDRFGLHRRPGVEHLASGSGLHHCPGAPPARREAEVALRALARRLPELRPLGSLPHRPGSAIRGWAAVPLALPRTVHR